MTNFTSPTHGAPPSPPTLCLTQCTKNTYVPTQNAPRRPYFRAPRTPYLDALTEGLHSSSNWAMDGSIATKHSAHLRAGGRLSRERMHIRVLY